MANCIARSHQFKPSLTSYSPRRPPLEYLEGGINVCDELIRDDPSTPHPLSLFPSNFMPAGSWENCRSARDHWLRSGQFRSSRKGSDRPGACRRVQGIRVCDDLIGSYIIVILSLMTEHICDNHIVDTCIFMNIFVMTTSVINISVYQR
jgi:hypothetical protein